MINLDTEIRKLGIAELSNLARSLSPDAWKDLMGGVLRAETKNRARFTSEDVRLIEEAARNQRRSPAEVFLDEWSTMGKKRPTVGSTIDLLVRAQLFRAADYLAVDVLKGEPPERPKDGPAAPVNVSELLNELNVAEANSETNVNNEEFCNKSTAEMNISCDLRNQDVGVFHMNFSEGKVEKVLDHPAENSNLIEFSKSISEESNSTKSDLIKFNTDSVQGTVEDKNPALESKNFLPSFTQLGISVDNQRGESIESVKQQLPGQLPSSDLPLCLQSTATNSSSTVSSSESSLSVDSSKESPAGTNSVQPDNLYLPALSQILPEDGNSKNPTASGTVDTSVPSASSQELPLTVLEFFKK